MNETQETAIKSIDAAARWPVLVGTLLTMSVSLLSPASAQSGDAEKILKGMADYVASQKALTVTYDSDVEVLPPIFRRSSSPAPARYN
jgi:hypothetical protein